MVLNGFICEGPRCNKGAGGRAVVIQWDASGTDPMSMPDEFFQFIGARPVYEEPSPKNQGQQPKERTFCSAECIRDYYNESRYTPPRSPRQQAAQAQANAENTRDGFGKPTVLGKAKIIPFPKSGGTLTTTAISDGAPVAVSQADGVGEDVDSSNFPA